MDLYARINGKDYPISYGAVFNDELSETLDSGQISIPHVFEIIDIKPYDDIIIHDFAPDENGNSTLPNRPYGVRIDTSRYYDADGNDITSSESATPAFAGHFYRHMLCWDYYRDTVNLADTAERADESGKKYQSRCFNYSIELISETKGLENVVLPNRTISQPQGTGEDSGKNTNNEVSFKFSANDREMTIPYGIAPNGDYRTGLRIASEDRTTVGTGEVDTYYLCVDDNIPSEPNYSFYTSVPALFSTESILTLPQWCSSGAVVFKETMQYVLGLAGVVKNLSATYIPFAKHWIIRKVGLGNWGTTRSEIVSSIENYLRGNAVEGIVNESLIDADTGNNFPHDILSYKKTASIRAKGFEEGEYIVYLYIDPVIRSYAGKTFNIYGMTDNSSGAVPPETKVSVPFLCSWSFTAGSQISLSSRGITSVYEAVREAVELYSPYEKVTEDGSSWEWRRKYSIAPETKAFFSNVIAPENQWSNPSLRDYITKLLYVCDCIPVVHDRVIGHLSLSSRSPLPFDTSKGEFTYDTYTMEGSSYCDRLRREYGDGLSKYNVTHCVDRIGFKNSDASTLTLENMRLELSHPIYRVKKCYLCSYKTATSGTKQYYWLCKYDISPLVKLNSERNILSEDWYNTQENVNVGSVEELAKYKYATVGYDIGSSYITGWGETCTYPDGFLFQTTKSVIENIYNFISRTQPLGVDAENIYSQNVYEYGEEVASNIAVGEDGNEFRILATSKNSGTESFVPGDDINAATGGTTSIGDFFGKFTQRLKSLFFIVEYDGYVSSAIMASKDYHDGPVVSRDSASASLSFVESDGQNQKEKVNRLGNAVISVAARYKNLEDIQNISQTWDEDVPEGERKLHEDEVLYKRTISVFKDYFQVGYTLCRDYVLRNYFTSVFSKHRPFALASYDESVERKENKCIQLLFSKDSQYSQESSRQVSLRDVTSFLSFFNPSEYDSAGNLIPNSIINKAYYIVWPSDIYAYPGQCGVFAADFQAFTSGNSLCFVVSMNDSVSAGVYQSDMNVKLSSYIGNMWDELVKILSSNYYEITSAEAKATNLLTGAKQDWHMFPVDPKTGVLYKMSFAVGKMSPNRPDDGESGPFEASYFRIAVASLLPLWDVCFTKPGLAGTETFTYYFGKSTVKVEDPGSGVPVPVQHIVGAGYPNLVFSRRNDDGSLYSDVGTYRVKQVNSSIAYSSKEVCTIVPMFEAVFEDADGYVLPAPPIVNSYAMALFYGHEDEEAEETDDCVFKDGKEKISTTIEIEPISDTSAILLSPYVMRLSDCIGNLEKNYGQASAGDYSVVVLPSVSYRRFLIKTSFISGTDYQFYHTTKANVVIPAVNVAIPREVTDQISGCDLGTTIEWPHGESGYKVTLGKMGAVQEASGRRFIDIEASISFGNPEAEQEEGDELPAPFNTTIRLWEINTTNYRYCAGRTGVSNCRASATFVLGSEGRYVNFGYCEDQYSTKVDDEAIELKSFCTYIGLSYLSPKKYEFYRVTSNGSPIGFPGDPDDPTPAESIIGYAISGGTTFNYFKTSRISVEYAQINGSNTVIGYGSGEDTLLVTEGSSSYSISVSLGIPVYVKRKNMFWELFPSFLFPDTPYKQLSSISEGNEINANVSVVESELGLPMLSVSLPAGSVNGPCSIRMYYLEDGIYHFVFGFNADSAANAGQRSDCLYPTDNGDGTMSYHVYVSLLDDRSKTVIDAATGDPSYRMANYANEEDAAKVPGKGNWCLPK